VVHLATNTTPALANLDVLNSVYPTTKTFDVRMTMAAPKKVCLVHKTSAVQMDLKLCATNSVYLVHKTSGVRMNLLAPNSVFRVLKILSVLIGLVAPPIVGLTVRAPLKTLFVNHLFAVILG
jgi:hypothetical protein